MKKTTIYLVDDHTILRDGIKSILRGVPELEVIGEAGDGKTAIEEIEKKKPSLVILDISLPVMTGIDVARHLKKYCPEIRIIILSQHGNEEYLNKLLNYGVESYLFKESASEYLVKAIDEVTKGNIYMDPVITKMLVDSVVSGGRDNIRKNPVSAFPSLSDREREIVKLIAEGHIGREIGGLLRISENTVKVHRRNIMKKLKIGNTTELLRYAIREGLVKL